MEKRFRDTSITRDTWYRKLTPIHKCFWNFLCDECDKSGVWQVDSEAIEFYLGQEVDINEFLAAVNLGKERVEWLGNEKLFVTGFVEFQYGTLTEKCVPHRRIIATAEKNGILDRVYVGYPLGYNIGYNVPSGKGKERTGQEEERKGKDVLPQKSKRTPNIKPERSTDEDLKAEYKTKIAEVQALPELKEQRLAVANFIQEKSPTFIEPFMDLWNLTVRIYKLPQVEGISSGRLNKFKTRIREPNFDFIKILTEIRQSDYLQGKDKPWRVDWDWIFENDTNYLKISEGKYRNQK